MFTAKKSLVILLAILTGIAILFLIGMMGLRFTSEPSLTPFQTDMEGKLFFLTSCAKCHGNQAQGTHKAPNLTDAYWQHGDGHLEDIVTLIEKGIPGTQMQGWSHKMRHQDILKIARYIHVLSHQKQSK